MCPPALIILAFSSGLIGLWSSDRAIAWPLRQSTDRLSPMLAKYIFLGVSKRMLAVVPTYSPMIYCYFSLAFIYDRLTYFWMSINYYSPLEDRIISSTLLNALRSALL